MKSFQVVIKSGESVVYAGIEEAADANEAINKAAHWAQLPFNSGEAYDAYDEDENSEPILKKVIMPAHGQFRVVV